MNMDEDEELYREMNPEDDFYMGPDETDINHDNKVKEFGPLKSFLIGFGVAFVIGFIILIIAIS